MNTNAQPADFDVRQQALDIGQSFAVAAPAGSGKTGLLTLRLLKLLCISNKPEEVLCITFTRKAAAEMRERLLAALAQAQNSLPPDASEHEQTTQLLAQKVLQRDAEQGWQLQTMPGRLRIQTIDSFCRSLAGQLPLASALGAEMATLENPDQAYRLAVAQLLERYASSSDGDLAEDLDVLVSHLDNQLGRLERLLMSLLARRDQWLGRLYQLKFSERETLENALRQWGCETVAKVRSDLAVFAGELLDCVRYAAANLINDNPDCAAAHLHDLTELPGDDDEAIEQQWKPLLELLLTNDDTWRKQVTVRQGFPAGKTRDDKALLQAQKQRFIALLGELKERPCLLDNLQELRAFPGSHYTDAQWHLLGSLTRLLPQLIAQLKLVFRQLGATDFVEVTEAALTALGDAEDPTDLALKLDHQIRHILVDEFQDTSTPQLELLHKLTEGWQPDDGRTLFVVGDGMQSCYGFRDANVGIFLDIRKRGLPSVPVEALDLTVNFRSRLGVVRWVNQVFAAAFPATDDIGRGAVRYSDSQAFDTSAHEECVTCVGFVDQSDHRREAEYIVEQIALLKQKEPSASIAVLVRGRAHLLDLIPALQAAQLPYRAVDIDPLKSRMAIVDLLSLTRALLDPTDRIAWLAILRAPWCGLPLPDLHAVATAEIGELNPIPKERGYPDIWTQVLNYEAIPNLSDTGRTILARFRPAVQAALGQIRRKPLRQWIEGTWLALGGPATTPTEEERLDVQAFLTLLEQHDSAGTIDSWREFQAALDKLYAQPLTAAGHPVELMTIHKSKGLEFDYVFLPGLNRRTRADDPPLLLWHQRLTANHENHLLLSPMTAATEQAPAPLYSFLQREKKLRNKLEDTRLLYVACTRARKRLWLTSNVQSDGKGGIKAPMDTCLLARVWDQLVQEMAVDDVAPQSDAKTVTAPTLKRLSVGWRLPPPAFSTPLADYRSHEFDNRELAADDDNPFLNRSARYRGTLWHAILRRLTLDGLDQWNTARLASQQPFWKAQALELGLTRTEAEAFLLRVIPVIKQLRDDKHARWLLDHNHTNSACEQRLVSAKGKQQLIVDRTFVDQGVRWIIDYKTAEPAAGQDQDEFLQQQRDAYSGQLEAYARAFRRMEVMPQALALYFPQMLHLELLQPVRSRA